MRSSCNVAKCQVMCQGRHRLSTCRKQLDLCLVDYLFVNLWAVGNPFCYKKEGNPIERKASLVCSFTLAFNKRFYRTFDCQTILLSTQAYTKQTWSFRHVATDRLTTGSLRFAESFEMSRIRL